MHHKIKGATIFSGMMGYGHKHHLHKPGKLGAGDERPLMLVCIDTDEAINVVLPHIKEIVKEGFIVLKEVKTP